MNPDVVFIGAGPVGLYTAINAKLLNPDLDILMLERYKQYNRSHILIVDKNSYVDSVQDVDFQVVLQELHGAIPTIAIEEKLRAYALKLGITIHIDKVTDVSALSKLYPRAHTIVGADGAHSIVRKQIFNDELIDNQNLQHIVEVKYYSQTQTASLALEHVSEGLSQINHFVYEHVGRPKEEGTPVSLFFFVDKKTYEQIRTKGTKLSLDDIAAGSSEMTALANSIHPWLALRRYHLNEKIVEQSVKIAAVALDNYRSLECAKTINGVRYILVGDAKLGIPYFRALNAGLIGARKAADLINQNSTASYNTEHYNKDMEALALSEIKRARKKNFTVNAGGSFAWWVRLLLIRIHLDFMSQEAKQAMEQARVTPIPFMVKYRRVFTTLAVFSLLAIILAASGGIAALPLGAALAAKVSIVGASIIYSTVLGFTWAFSYTALAAVIAHSRRKRPAKNEVEIKPDNANCLIEPGVDLNANIQPDASLYNSDKCFSHPANLYQVPNNSKAKSESSEIDLTTSKKIQ